MRRVLAGLLLIAAVVAVYAPGLNGPFVYDDHPNITGNELVHISDLSLSSLRQAAFSSTAGPLHRPISMASFGANYALTGEDSFYFKLTNLLIHLLNALLVGGLVWRFVSTAPGLRGLPISPEVLSLAVTALWALHPLQLTSVLYVVQRMTELSALFTLVALHFYLDGRVRLDQDQRGSWPRVVIALAVWTPLAVLSKENGILVLAYAWVIELFAFQNAASDAARKRRRLLFVSWSIVAALGAAFLLRMRGLEFTEPYAGKSFSGLDQIRTAPRVLCWYLQMLVAPDLRQLGLVHDDWTISSSLLVPPLTWAVIAFWIVALGGSLYFRRSMPWIGFGIWWFVAGHSLEAAPIGLDLVYEHRNYLPSAGVLFTLVVAAAMAVKRYAIRRWAAGALLGAAVLAVSVLTGVRVNEWRDIASWANAQLLHHPDSAASAYFLGGLFATLAEQQPAAREALFAKADTLFARSGDLNPAESHAAIARVVLRLSLGKDTPDEMYDDIAARLQRGRLDASAQSALTGLIECSTVKECVPAEAKLLLVVNAALDSPLCSGSFSSRILARLADYYGNARNDPRRAVTYAKAATERPGAEVATWLTLIQWLAVTGHLAEATKAMDELDFNDRQNALARPRAQMRAELDKAARSTPGSLNP